MTRMNHKERIILFLKSFITLLTNSTLLTFVSSNVEIKFHAQYCVVATSNFVMVTYEVAVLSHNFNITEMRLITDYVT